jgi:hypothetical protein
MRSQQWAQGQLLQQQAPPVVMGRVWPSLNEAATIAPPEAVTAAPMAPAAPPLDAACEAARQCVDNTGTCPGGMGCLTQDATGAVMCSCGAAAPAAAPPAASPPPVRGSEKWMQDPDNVIVSPGPEEAAAGSNLAMMESGNIAVNLNDYLRYKAQREEVTRR